MNHISVSDSAGDYKISVHKGVTKDAVEQVEISIYRPQISSQSLTRIPENLTLTASDWMAVVHVVEKLRGYLYNQPVSP